MIYRSREVIDTLQLRKVDVAERMGITPVGLNQILNTEKPKLETLEKLAKAINVSVWKLYLSDEEIREIELIADKGNNESDLTALIQHKADFYKAESLEELEAIVKKIKSE